MTTIAMKSARLREGLALPYAESGYPDGTPVVFVHGIGDSWWTFEPLLQRLPVSLHGYAPTQRGHGDADRPPEGYRPEDFAADLVLFLDSVGIDRAVLVGSSSGGVPARIVAGRYPDRVLGLVLAGVPAALADKAAVMESWETVQQLEDPVDRRFVEDLMTGMVAGPVGRGFLETMIDENLKPPARVWRETMRGLLEADLPATLAGILVPTLLIWGDADVLLPHSDQEAILDAIPGSRLLVYEGVGHVVHWEQPERVVRDVVDFVAQVAGPGPGAIDPPDPA